MSVATLVFPSSMPAAIRYSHQALQRGEKVIAASSLAYDETASHYAQWLYLPSIYDPAFETTFIDTVSRHSITHFYTPHAVVYNMVRRIVIAHQLTVTMTEVSPLEELETQYRTTITHTSVLMPFIASIAPAHNIQLLQVCAILDQAQKIYGQTGESKILAMIAACCNAPKGDLVEIGSAWGRSAFLLSFLARLLGVGKVLSVDPWLGSTATQSEAENAVEEANQQIDWELMHHICIMHLLPFADIYNFLRMPSLEAAPHYAANKTVATTSFGQTNYQGTIALLHIDGNHDYASVSADIAAWIPHLAPKGWIVLDDYVWEHGNGPRRAGDALLQAVTPRILHAFTCGKALFIQLEKAS